MANRPTNIYHLTYRNYATGADPLPRLQSGQTLANSLEHVRKIYNDVRIESIELVEGVEPYPDTREIEAAEIALENSKLRRYGVQL